MTCRSEWRTQRIRLRRFVKADAAALAAVIFAEADVMKTLIGDASTPARQLALAAEWIARWDACWDEHGHGVWAVEIADPSLGEVGTLIGFSGFEAPVLSGEGPELIAGRGSAWWSQGISTELGHAVVAHLFSHTDTPSVHALVFSVINPAADRQMEKLGFTFAGVVPIHARVGPSYQRDTLRFELERVALARPGREREVLALAAFKVGQLLGCRAAGPELLRAQARAVAPASIVDEGWEAGWAQPLDPDEWQALGTGWVDAAVERRLRRLATATEPATRREHAAELGRLARSVALVLERARDTLHERAAARGLADGRELVEERLRAGLEDPTMRLYRLTRSDHARAGG